LTASAREIAPAKLNLALHVRGKLPDGRHAIETVFAFCTDGDSLSAEQADEISLTVAGPLRHELGDGDDNLVVKAARALASIAGVGKGAALNRDKKQPEGSPKAARTADAPAALRH
jgi:4-diphosphocytidyl-2-C-methyl-D-erythritol kinase